MTCRDCLHYEACKGTYFAFKQMIDKDSFDNEHYADVYNCPDFTDRSEWVHLPCEVGDIVFYFQGAYHLKNKSMWKIRPIKVTEFSMKMGKNGKLYPLSIIANGTRYPLTSIGKTLFLSRKEAEKALEEKK